MKGIFLILLILAGFVLLSGCTNPSQCGDGICSSNENLLTCSEDCGISSSNSSPQSGQNQSPSLAIPNNPSSETSSPSEPLARPADASPSHLAVIGVESLVNAKYNVGDLVYIKNPMKYFGSSDEVYGRVEGFFRDDFGGINYRIGDIIKMSNLVKLTIKVKNGYGSASGDVGGTIISNPAGMKCIIPEGKENMLCNAMLPKVKVHLTITPNTSLSTYIMDYDLPCLEDLNTSEYYNEPQVCTINLDQNLTGFVGFDSP